MTEQRTPDSAEARYKAEVDRVNRITDREIDEALAKFPKVLAALHESERAEPCFECGSTERIGTACKPCNPELDPSAIAGAIERLRGTPAQRSLNDWLQTAPADILTVCGHVEIQALRIETLEGERDLALKECVRLATEAGSAKGKLEASEAAGIVDGWRQKCERYETALTKIARLRTELRGDFSMGSQQSDIAREALGTEGRDDG